LSHTVYSGPKSGTFRCNECSDKGKTPKQCAEHRLCYKLLLLNFIICYNIIQTKYIYLII